MPRKLTPSSSLENLTREAKRWLKALRANVDEARARLERALPNAPANPTLRDVQHALAHEHGVAGWAALREMLARSRSPDAASADIVTRFLDNACPEHHVRGASDHLRARSTALRILERFPEVAHASFATQIVCGELQSVEQALRSRPDLASLRRGAPSADRSDVGNTGDLDRDLGPKGWEPLLYLCFTRLPLPAVSNNAVAIARALLDAGADPNAYFMAGDSHYTPLVGVIGEGEEDRPPHPQRDALVRLLLERGAEPYDIQVVYNIHFHGKVLWFLEAMYDRALQLGRKADWDDPEWSMLNMGGYGSGARWHLEIAIRNNDLRLAAWCLAHGANPNAAPARDRRLPQTSLYELAVRLGGIEMADLLVRNGAKRTDVVLDEKEAFLLACLRLDRDDIRSRVARSPDLLTAPEPLLAAARQDRADVVEFLLDCGMSPDVANERQERALHIASYNNALRVAALLIARGAEIDPIESNYSNTPLACAVYYQHAEMIALLGRFSRDVWELTYSGNVERLRQVLLEEPSRARVATGGQTPLMWLPPGDEARAIEIARLLLACGADPTVRTKEGSTAADRAERLGMFELTEILKTGGRIAPRPTLREYEEKAEALLEAYRTGTSEAMERHWSQTWHRRNWKAMRTYVQLDLGRQQGTPTQDDDITLADARFLVAREHAFDSWQALVDYVTAIPANQGPIAARPVTSFSFDEKGERRPAVSDRNWSAMISSVKEMRIPGLNAEGQMTDDVLEMISRLDHVTALDIGGSKQVTDEGAQHLARMLQLQHLDLQGTAITDRGLEALRQLRALRTLNLGWTRVTDAGMVHLGGFDQLESVDLTGTHTGDDAIRSLGHKPALRLFRSGSNVTDAGLPHLHDFPVFETWQGGEPQQALLEANHAPNELGLHGTFTDAGLATMVGLDGLFGLDLGDRASAVTARGLAPLAKLAHLGRFFFDATDEAMPYIAAMPKLRFLMCQDTVAGDVGFTALSRSSSIELIWGRRCHNLRAKGFVALASMPALRSLAVSCKNVDDDALAALPRFPSLRELMPMEMPDEGYRHIARCERLEALILMYCRETTDRSTELISAMPNLTRYFASYNRITDRTPEILSGILSLERVQFSACAGLTNAGIAKLAQLPRLRELRLDGMTHVTAEIAKTFPAHVRVNYSP